MYHSYLIDDGLTRSPTQESCTGHLTSLE